MIYILYYLYYTQLQNMTTATNHKKGTEAVPQIKKCCIAAVKKLTFFSGVGKRFTKDNFCCIPRNLFQIFQIHICRG